jgi:hypothetical protein
MSNALRVSVASLTVVVGVLVAVAGCKKTGELPADRDGGEAPPGASSPSARSETASAPEEDGPDCQTLVADVRQACLDHYLEGLDVDCHSFITSTNVAVMQSGGALFKDPSGNNPAAASRAGAVMCASTGKQLRAAIAAAAKTPPPPGCKALGRALDEPCFRKIGTPDYQGRCSGHLIATKKVPSDAMCSVQLTAAKGNGLVK